MRARAPPPTSRDRRVLRDHRAASSAARRAAPCRRQERARHRLADIPAYCTAKSPIRQRAQDAAPDVPSAARRRLGGSASPAYPPLYTRSTAPLDDARRTSTCAARGADGDRRRSAATISCTSGLTRVAVAEHVPAEPRRDAWRRSSSAPVRAKRALREHVAEHAARGWCACRRQECRAGAAAPATSRRPRPSPHRWPLAAAFWLLALEEFERSRRRGVRLTSPRASCARVRAAIATARAALHPTALGRARRHNARSTSAAREHVGTSRAQSRRPRPARVVRAKLIEPSVLYVSRL